VSSPPSGNEPSTAETDAAPDEGGCSSGPPADAYSTARLVVVVLNVSSTPG
jgi:hypothetical protein